jgi:flagellar P-ring protein precursor FlgI
VAVAEDAVSVRLTAPGALAGRPVEFLAQVQAVEVRPDVMAKVVVNEKTGTVVIGSAVRVAQVALSHGNLTIEVRTYLETSQPAPLSEGGETVVVPQTETFVQEGPDRVIRFEEGVTVGEIVDALNAVGASSRDMIAIFQAMRAAGALHAEIVVL